MVCQQVAHTSPRSSDLPKRRTPRSLLLSLEVAALRNELAELRALVQPAVAAAAAPPSYVSPEAKEAKEAEEAEEAEEAAKICARQRGSRERVWAEEAKEAEEAAQEALAV